MSDASSVNLASDVETFFATRYRYTDVAISVKQRGRQVLLKFPVLRRLGLAKENESDWLHIRIDLTSIPSPHYGTVVSSKSRFGLNYAAVHYDLPSLMAGKLHAILSRHYQKGGGNQDTIKGRDYFDLLWFVKEGVKPNLLRLSDMLSETITLPVLERRIDGKVEEFISRFKRDYATDMIPLIRNSEIIDTYTTHYQDEYLRFKAQSFSEKIRLFVKCTHCSKEFRGGMTLSPNAFATFVIRDSEHPCPFCGHLNVIADKGGYLLK